MEVIKKLKQQVAYDQERHARLVSATNECNQNIQAAQAKTTKIYEQLAELRRNDRKMRDEQMVLLINKRALSRGVASPFIPAQRPLPAEVRAQLLVQVKVRDWLNRRKWVRLYEQYSQTAEAQITITRNAHLRDLLQTTERQFHEISFVVEHYLEALRMAADSVNHIVSHVDLDIVFSNLVTLRHSTFVLHQRLQDSLSGSSVSVGRALSDMAGVLESAYSHYSAMQSRALSHLETIRDTNSLLTDFLQRLEMDEAVNGLTLAHCLSLPLSYPTHLSHITESISASTPNVHIDFDPMKEAVRKLSEMRKHVEEQTANATQRLDLLNLASNFADQSQILFVFSDPTRKIIDTLSLPVSIDDSESGNTHVIFLSNLLIFAQNDSDEGAQPSLTYITSISLADATATQMQSKELKVETFEPAMRTIFYFPDAASLLKFKHVLNLQIKSSLAAADILRSEVRKMASSGPSTRQTPSASSSTPLSSLPPALPPKKSVFDEIGESLSEDQRKKNILVGIIANKIIDSPNSNDFYKSIALFLPQISTSAQFVKALHAALEPHREEETKCQRVCAFLCVWIDAFFTEDFIGQGELAKDVSRLLSLVSSDATKKNVQDHVQRANEQSLMNIQSKENYLNFKKSLVAQVSVLNVSPLNYSVVEIACEITLMDFGLYSSLTARDIFEMGRDNETCEWLRHTHKMIRMFSKEIKSVTAVSQKIEMLSKVINAGKRCLTHWNYNGVFIAVRAVADSEIMGDSFLWSKISSADTATYNEILTVMAPANKYECMRREIAKAFIPPVIPCIDWVKTCSAQIISDNGNLTEGDFMSGSAALSEHISVALQHVTRSEYALQINRNIRGSFYNKLEQTL